MDKKRKEWAKKNNIKIAENGFIENFCGLPNHVKPILSDKPYEVQKYIGFDGRTKTYSQLTPEEKVDLEENPKRTIKNLEEKYRERTRRIKNICDTEQEKHP